MTAIAFALARFKVADLPGLEKFYTEALGFTVAVRVTDGAGEDELHEIFLSLGNAQPQFALLHYPNRIAPQPGEAVIAFIVDDLRASVAAVEAHGGTNLTGIVDVPEHNMKLAFVTDPEGHTVELMQMTTASNPPSHSPPQSGSGYD
jgi:catechol 2,3-dioxygenase-like lactoylglutathione lyase family enzyme